MALLKYFKRKHELVNPRGSLSSSISPRVIASANCEVEEEIRKVTEKKRGPYIK